jgi:hypothetical protein
MTWLIQVFPTEKTDAPKRVMVWAEIEAGTIPELLAKAKAEYPDAKLGAFMKGKIS